jgi:hypothetical protein
MTSYYPPCSPEDGEGAPCGHCTLLICCHDHWKNVHMPSYHGDQPKCMDETCDCMAREDDRVARVLKLGKYAEGCEHSDAMYVILSDCVREECRRCGHVREIR